MGNCKRIDLVILLLAAFHSALVSSEKPLLKIYPEQTSVNSPSLTSYVLTCKAVTDEDDAFTGMEWRNPNNEVIEEETGPQSGGVRKMGKILKLTFATPRVQDSGEYTCSAIYMNTDELKSSIIVNFYDDIKFEDCNEQQSLVLGTPGEIRCRAVGDPIPEVSWAKDSQTVTTDSRYVVSSDKLSILGVVEDDQGTYTVEAFVPATGQNKYMNIEVTVQIPPKIVDLPEEMRVIENERYDIQCKATGFPRPKITWLDPEGKDLSVIPGFDVNSDDGTLIIEKVEHGHSGQYTCRAENDAGFDEKKMPLKVTVKPKITSFENITLEEGQKAEFRCSAQGEPAPTVAIRKDKGENFKENEDPRIQVQHLNENGMTILTVIITHSKRTDDGLYFCSAENDGARVEKAGYLEVQFPPNMSSTKVRDVKTWPANPANITCIAEANPNASISWKFGNEEITADDDRYIIYGTRSISNLMVKLSETANQNVYGTYTCIARNPLGEQSVEIRLEEATIPGQLSQVLFDQATPTTITFGLLGPSFDGGMPIISYVARYKMEAPGSEEKTIEWPKGSPYIISSLKPRTHYMFKLAAKNAVGIGDWKERTYLMPEETSPSPPIFITSMETVSDYSDRFEIKWIIPDDNGKPIEYFEIRYFKVERDVDSWKQLFGKMVTTIKVDKGDVSSYELTNLDANTFYKAELRAHNEIGNSQPGVVVFRTRSGEVPDEQTSMIENGVIPLAGIIAIAVVAVLIILIVMDVTCYLRYQCGLLYVMRYQTCGRSPSSEKVKDIAVEDGPECVKEISTANNGKIKTEIKTPSPKATSPVQPSSDKQSEDKSKSEVDNLAFEGRDTRPADLIIDQNYKNRSPKGSKSSLAKSSPV